MARTCRQVRQELLSRCYASFGLWEAQFHFKRNEWQSIRSNWLTEPHSSWSPGPGAIKRVALHLKIWVPVSALPPYVYVGQHTSNIIIKLGCNIAASKVDSSSRIPVHDHCVLRVGKERDPLRVQEDVVKKLREIIGRKEDGPPAFSIDDWREVIECAKHAMLARCPGTKTVFS
ncbi:hypothetical protein K491DRAFT_510105 [Lophiostoma macrostomum CBS 122681]|uniref:Uncharacterized protein n=1 Tax=Lophiostoma macrostomum CBS 122681 TaxID=1314788 RepID=A0A6A6T164_9PLEO|nr:hypothetical protein K491DRAFT_510105 [Lophiostoma macrostomum CBS 122681]